MLVVWLVTKVLALGFSASRWSNGFSSLASAALFAWAYFEVVDGDSPFRKALGLAVLIYVTYSLLVL